MSTLAISSAVARNQGGTGGDVSCWPEAALLVFSLIRAKYLLGGGHATAQLLNWSARPWGHSAPTAMPTKQPPKRGRARLSEKQILSCQRLNFVRRLFSPSHRRLLVALFLAPPIEFLACPSSGLKEARPDSAQAEFPLDHRDEVHSVDRAPVRAAVSASPPPTGLPGPAGSNPPCPSRRARSLAPDRVGVAREQAPVALLGERAERVAGLPNSGQMPEIAVAPEGGGQDLSETRPAERRLDDGRIGPAEIVTRRKFGEVAPMAVGKEVFQQVRGLTAANADGRKDRESRPFAAPFRAPARSPAHPSPSPTARFRKPGIALPVRTKTPPVIALITTCYAPVILLDPSAQRFRVIYCNQKIFMSRSTPEGRTSLFLPC